MLNESSPPMEKDKQKTLGQVWTPEPIVNLILDKVGYKEKIVLSSKILEPSFGEGIFLKKIIDRIVLEGKLQGLSSSDIQEVIDNNLYGVEYDEETFFKAKTNLIKWAKENYGISITLPFLIQKDALLYKKPDYFDFVVGNPPYVRVHNLPQEMRELVKTYAHSTGTTDLYVIFYELGLTWLNSKGKLGFIAPNGWTKSASQKNMRRTLINERYLKEILDFGKVNVFPGISTYTNITILDKSKTENLKYSEMETETLEKFTIIKPYTDISKTGDPLVFVREEDELFLSKFKADQERKDKSLEKFGKVQNGLATLADKIFLSKQEEVKEMFNLPVVKASTYKGQPIEQFIVFPYKQENDKYRGITEEEFKSQAPLTYKRFIEEKDALEKRSLDKGSNWFWYGRSQSIQETGKMKLVLSPLVHPDTPIKTYLIPANTLVYSGLFITSKLPEEEDTLNLIKSHLETPEFLKYANLLGKNMSGGYKTISTPIIKSFILTNLVE